MGDPVSFIATLVLSSVTREQNRKKISRQKRLAAEKALAATREANQIESRTSFSNQAIPVAYGECLVDGSPVYWQVAKTLTNPSLPLSSYNITERLIGGQSAWGITRTNDNYNRYGAANYDVCGNPISDITFALINGTPATADEFDNARQLGWARGGPNLKLTPGIYQIGSVERVESTMKFTGITMANCYFWLDIDGKPAYAADIPHLQFYVRGAARGLYVAGGRMQVGSLPGYRNRSFRCYNPVTAMLDWISDDVRGNSHYGAQFPLHHIDMPSFQRSQSICADRISYTTNTDPTSGKYWNTSDSAAETADNFWNRAYPRDRNGFDLTAHSTYGDYLASVTEMSSTNEWGLNTRVGLLGSAKTSGTGSLSSSRPLHRYEFNGKLDTLAPWTDGVERLKEAIPGSSFFRSLNGKWKFVIPTPLDDLTNLAVIDHFEIDTEFTETWPTSDTRLNAVTVGFSNVENDYAADELYFPIGGSSMHTQLRDADGGMHLHRPFQVHGIHNRYHAAAWAATTILLSRRPTYSWTSPRTHLNTEPGDIIILRNRYADVNVYARITDRRIAPDWSIRFEAVQFSRTDYDLYVSDAGRLILPAEKPPAVT